jgi:hypothetical protein
MISLKKIEIEKVLIQIIAFDPKTQKPASGLLTENTTLGMKRRLQKIHSTLMEKYKEYTEDIKKIEQECKDDMEKMTSEINVLNQETVFIDCQPIDSKQLDAIVTDTNYNFDILEKICE